MNNEKRLLSKAIADRNLAPLFERNVNQNWFSDESDKKVWIFIRSHFSTYGECPTLEVLQDNFKSYKLEENNADAVDYLLDAVTSERRKAATADILREAVDAIAHDPEEALLAMQRGVVTLDSQGFSQTNDVDITKTVDKRIERYERRKEIPDGMLGYPTGFPTIDRVTNGLQGGQLIVITATPKTGKSTLALQVGHNIHRSQQRVAMFWSFEMSNREQEDRYDALRSRVSFQRYITGALHKDEELRLKTSLGYMRNEKSFILVDSSSGSTLSGVTAKLQIHRPEILFIDGMYLMQDEQSGEFNTPQALTNLTRGMKRLAQRFDIPIVITTQSLDWKKEKGRLTANSIGYSSSFFQDADVVFGLEKQDGDIDETRVLRILASRNSGPGEVNLTWEWDQATFREMIGDDA
jgi:replicative DNA helicase